MGIHEKGEAKKAYLPVLAPGAGRIAVFVEKKPFFGAISVHIPFLRELRELYPGARVTVLSPSGVMRLLADCGAADEFLEYEWSFAGMVRLLRAMRPDLVFVLRPASRGLDLAVAFSGCRASGSYMSWLGRLVYDRIVPQNSRIYRARKYFTLLMERESAAAAPLDAWFREAAAKLRAPERGRTLAVLPCGSGGHKLWGAKNYIALCERLAAEDPGLKFLWVLGPAEERLRGELEASLPGRTGVLCGASLPELAAAALSCAAAVGNDCGPGHVFQMCGCPFVCLLGDADGRAALVADEWLDGPNRRLALFPPPGSPIGAIMPEEAAAAVSAVLGAAPGTMRSAR